ncbi:MAG: hypothetical protein IKC20_04375 [Clostridia bacterium]|nr:hypothetical protein [Clostridia bacterium]
MKKEEFINIIDDIQPDIHMKNRLKAKVIGGASCVKPKRITRAVVAVCLAAIIVLGTGFVGKRPLSDPEKPTEGTTQNIVLDMMSGFIVLASAYDGETEEENQTVIPLEINEGYDCGIKLIATDIRGLTDSEKKKIRTDLDNGIYAYCDEEGFFRGRSHTDGTDEIYLTRYSVNEFRLNLEEGRSVKTVTVKNTSEYGQLVYSVGRPVFSAPEHGHEIVVSGEKFNSKTDGFYWEHTDEMLKALSENNGISFSAFNDTVTFTVEYTDGVKATGVVDIVFNENGEATAICKDYTLK